MSILARNRIKLGAHAKDKADAIRQCGALLVSSGCVTAEYVDGMLAREASMSTSLNVGVAIPHGMYDNRDHIKHTGISVLQLVEGVPWENEDDIVRLVIGIAASSDEHVGVLSSLADVIDDEERLNALFVTADPDVVMNTLSAAPAA